MSQNKHQPKESKGRFSISKDAEKTLIGICIALISIIGVLNRGFLGEFLTYISVYLFGAFYVFFFFMFIFWGIYLAVKRKTFSIKLNLYLLGAILLVLGLMMSASLSIDNLKIKSLVSVYNEQMKLVSSRAFCITSFDNLGTTGGGFIASFFTALLNSGITKVGTWIVVIFIIIAGSCLLLKEPLKKLFAFIKVKLNERKNKKAGVKVEAASDVEVMPEENKVQSKNEIVEEQLSPSLAFRTYEPHTQKQEPLIDEEEVKDEKKSDEVKEEFTEKKKDDVHEGFFNLFRKKVEPEEKLGDEEVSSPKTDVVPPQPVPSFAEEKNTSVSEPQVRQEFSFSIAGEKNEPEEEKVQVPETSSNSHYILPGIDMLSEHIDDGKVEININESISRAKRINEVLKNFDVQAEVISYTIGPSVTRFDVKTNPGVRVGAIAKLVNEFQVALNGDKSVRIEPVVQGKATSGIEVGNKEPTTVSFKDCFRAINDRQSDKLVVPLGQDVNHEVITISIDDLPHLLVAGTTGSGKSVFIHALIMTLIMRNYPDELRLIMIDPKKVEFSKYNNIPHLYCPIITDPVQATAALFKLINEMERRFTIMAREEVVNIKEYRNKAKDHPEKEVIPNIVVIIDEFADLISNNAKEVEPQIQRLAQKARAAGIYLIIATQRPSVNVITGDIKANIPARVALMVNSSIDSKTILDETGAETLIGRGDLLAHIPTSKALVRVQSAYVDNKEISRVTEYLKAQGKPVFNQEFLNLRVEKDEDSLTDGSGNYQAARRHDKIREDPLYQEIKNFVIDTQTASSSSIMRNFGLGFGRAAAYLDTLEEDGVIKSVANGRKAVIVKREE